jgi:hypothetical protein
MAKYSLHPTTVDAFVILTISPPDGNGNVAVQASDPGAAGTIPYEFPQAEVSNNAPGDYVVIDDQGNVTLVTAVQFNTLYVQDNED